MKVVCVKGMSISAVANVFTQGEEYEINENTYQRYSDHFKKKTGRPQNKKQELEEIK